MELQDFLISAFDSFKQSIEKEYLKKLQEHRDNISINTNPVEYTENYGKLYEIIIAHSIQCENQGGPYFYKDNNITINIIKNNFLSKLDKDLYIINNFIITMDKTEINCYQNNSIQNIRIPSINLIIDNCGNIYRYDYYSSRNQYNANSLNETFNLVNNVSKQPLCNFIINKIKNMLIIKDTVKSSKTYNKLIQRCPHYHQSDSTNDINLIYDMFNMIRDINNYIYEKFAISIDNFKLNESLKELTEEKSKLESELFVNSKSNEKLNLELEIFQNDVNRLSSELKESLIEIEKLKRQLEEKNNLIIELSIENRRFSNLLKHNNDNPPPYSN